jgi:DNA-directed RNA polymerase subunit N (RpoN/RPB10)
MSFFKNLFSPARPIGTFYSFSVKCMRCGEIIHGRVNIYNEPSLELNEKGKPYYMCRKVLIGNGYCFQQIEVFFKFDAGKRVLDREISGGEFVGD